MTDWSPTSPLNARRPLYRSVEPKVAGIASGIAEHFAVNANIVRMLFGVFALAGGAGFLLYLGLWILVPLPPQVPLQPQPSGKRGSDRSTRSLIFGGAMLAMAILLGLVTIGGFDPLRFIMLSLLFIGVTLLNRRPKSFVPPPAPMPIPPPIDMVAPPPIDEVFTTAPMPDLDNDLYLNTNLNDDLDDDATTEIETSAESVTTDLQITDSETTELEVAAPEELVSDEWPEPTAQMAQPTAQNSQPTAQNSLPSEPTGQPQPPLVEPLPPEPAPPNPSQPLPVRPFQDFEVDEAAPRTHWAVPKTAEETSLTASEPTSPSAPLASITLAAILAVLGIALVLNTLADIFVGAVTISGISVAFVGLAIAGTSFKGTTLPLIPIAFVALLALMAAPTIDHAIQDGTGSKDLKITSVAELDARYVLGVGELVLDLRGLELTEDVTLDVAVGTGSLEVWVPRDMVVEVNAKTTVGYAWAFDEGRGGINPELRLRPPPSADPDAPRLFLNTETTIGAIDVYRG